ncbi:MAG: GMC family oxidoreductase [Proteobacteria bacterium]|nr:GMC family oxidoreductase [Pseudomonadota bacterium]
MTRRFRDADAVDFAIVGSGAAGGVIARELALAGHQVLVLEQGPRRAAADFEHDEFKYWLQSGITNDPRTSPVTFRRTAAEVAQRPDPAGINPLWYARTVGGSSTHFTGNYWRFHDVDFHERSLLGSIPGADLADWPLTYDELEPYYTRVDWEIGVSGLAGAHPNEPRRSRPYPMPPMPVKSSGVLLERGARRLGLHPFPAPLAIASQPYRGRAACVHCGFCMGFGCEATAKASTLYNMIPEAEATGRCEIRAESLVFRISLDARGRANGLHYFDRERREHFQKAKCVVLCANGAETPRLLLLSAGGAHPDGLANSSGLVGKYLMFNQGAGAWAEFEHALNEYKSVQVTRIVHDFYDADPKRGFYGGGGIDGRIGPNPILWALSAPDGPSWGRAYKERLRAFPRTMLAMSHTTSLAVESNSVSLDPDVKDAWGLPALRCTYRDHPDDLKFAGWQQERAVEILEAAGARRVWRQPVAEHGPSPHLLGTCRMGADPARSVVDRYHRTHDVRNLFICDGSSFVTSGRGQPTMTIQALAFRAAAHLDRFARAGEI